MAFKKQGEGLAVCAGSHLLKPLVVPLNPRQDEGKHFGQTLEPAGGVSM